MIAVAGGIILAIVALAIVARIIGALNSVDDHPPPESARSIARRKALQAKLARGPCYYDTRHGVRAGLRKWDWPG